MEEQIKKIALLFQQNDIVISNEQAEMFFKYYKCLIEYNTHTNLTAITDFDDVVVKHFVDSCKLSKYIKRNASLCDIGTGAGFPGIPLKIIRNDLNIVLVDSLEKRVKFLNMVIQELNLQKISAKHSRIQEFSMSNREFFDYTTARAVAQLNSLIELCVPITKVSGTMIAMKSVKTSEEINNCKNALKELKSEIKDIYEYTIILNNDKQTRTAVLINKNEKTPTKYPRMKNLITSNPL